jgi:hypothetical protein
MTKIKTNDDGISNIELLMKFCSKLHLIIGYPYYFNWSTATNYYDESVDGELHDIGYAMFRVGKYDKLEEVPDGVVTDRRIPVDKQTVFGPIPSIVKFLGINLLTRHKGVEIKSWEDVETHKELIMKCIDEYIAKDDKQ